MIKEEALRIYLNKPSVRIDQYPSKLNWFTVEGIDYMILTDLEGKDLLHQYQEYEIDDIKDRLTYKGELKLFNFINWDQYFTGSTLEDYNFKSMTIDNETFYFTIL